MALKEDHEEVVDQGGDEQDRLSDAVLPDEKIERKFPSLSLRAAGIVGLALLGPLLAIAVGLYIYLVGGRFVSTDNAYVKSDKIAVSTDVSGRVLNVAVAANQEVKVGDLLFRLDPEPLRIALNSAEARVSAAKQAIGALRAIYQQKLANAELAKGELKFFEAENDRQRTLVAKRIVSRKSFDTSMNELRNARDKHAIALQDVAVSLARLGGAANGSLDAHPRVREAKAAWDRARLDLKRTEVRAPVDGVITNFDLQAGEYIKAGDVVFSLVGSADVWVQANFKETELTHVRVGQPATLTIDAYPGTPRKAVVASISPATGAEFSLLPPQNATGNWVKVVQRLTVRLKLAEPLSEPRLRAGMSVIAEIDTGHKREVSGILGTVRCLGARP